MCTAKGSDVRPGVPRVFCVAGVGQCEQPRGRMYALASLGLHLFCAAGVGQCALPRGRMYALASLGLRLFCVPGVGQCALPRGRMYALASLGLCLFCVAGVGQCALLVAFAGQVWDTVLTLIHTHSFTFTSFESLTHSLKSLIPTHALTSLTQSLNNSLTPSHLHTLTHSLTHTLAQKYLIELLLWSASGVHKQSPKV